MFNFIYPTERMTNAELSFDQFSNYENSTDEDMDDENKYANLGLSLNRYDCFLLLNIYYF